MASEERNRLTTEDVLTDLKRRGIDVRDLGLRRVSLSVDTDQRLNAAEDRIKKLLRRD